jgi:hypothetical protein
MNDIWRSHSGQAGALVVKNIERHVKPQPGHWESGIGSSFEIADASLLL